MTHFSTLHELPLEVKTRGIGISIGNFGPVISWDWYLYW